MAGGPDEKPRQRSQSPKGSFRPGWSQAEDTKRSGG